MKISQPLHQFDKERAILIVLGRKNGIFYFAHSGTIKKADQFDVEPKSYSDREGFLLRSGRGEFFGSGISLKDLREHVRAKFLSELGESIRHLEKVNSANAIYIFSPQGLIPLILGTIGTKKRNKIIKEVIAGNMTKKHPLDLIKQIEIIRNNRKKNIVNNKEAEKILKKSNQARKIIKGKKYFFSAKN